MLVFLGLLDMVFLTELFFLAGVCLFSARKEDKDILRMHV